MTIAYNDRSDLACKIAISAVRTVFMEENGRTEIDIKRYAKVEKAWFIYSMIYEIKIALINYIKNIIGSGWNYRGIMCP